MNRQYKYELMPYAEMRQRGLRKGICPQCGKQRLSQYVNVKTRELAGQEFGMCERRIECGYNRYPHTQWVERQDSARDAIKILRLPPNAFKAKCQSDAKLHPKDRSTFDRICYGALKRIRGRECVDDFNQFMNLMGVTTQNRICAGARPGTAFWLLDEKGLPCDAQLKDFVLIDNELRTFKGEDGKAVMHTAHSLLRAKGYIAGNSKPPRCLFGQHRIAASEGLTVHIFESPKTAVMMSLWSLVCQQFRGDREQMPLCVSCMSLTGLRWLWRDRDHYSRMAPIIQQHPRWVLHPDLKAESEWQKDAEGLKQMYGGVWDVDLSLRKFATADQVQAGFDWADFIFASSNSLICDSDLRAYARVPKEYNEECESDPITPIDPQLQQILEEPEPDNMEEKIMLDEAIFDPLKV